MPAKLNLVPEPVAKFIVFKREEFDKHMESFSADGSPNSISCVDALCADEVDDAEVIRKKDLLAGPALHAYASAAQNALEILESKGFADTSLEGIRDHFFAAAQEADLYHAKRLPD